jgi:hypothetical protein
MPRITRTSWRAYLWLFSHPSTRLSATNWHRFVAYCLLDICSLTVVVMLLFPPVARVREASPRTTIKRKLSELAIAMHRYAGEHQDRLPPAAVWGREGQPLLSWRVMLLPYIEHEDLYLQFRLDEPWDSQHNLVLLSRMPKEYAPPEGMNRQTEPFTTFFQVFVGEGTAFERKNGLKIGEDIFNTILVAEAGQPVPWTRPEDLGYEPDRPLPPLGGILANLKPPNQGWCAAFGDGTVRVIGPGTDEETIRAAVTRKEENNK